MVFFHIRQSKGLWTAYDKRLKSFVKLMSKNCISIVRKRNGQLKRKWTERNTRNKSIKTKWFIYVIIKKMKQRLRILVYFVRDVYSFTANQYPLGVGDQLTIYIIFITSLGRCFLRLLKKISWPLMWGELKRSSSPLSTAGPRPMPYRTTPSPRTRR